MTGRPTIYGRGELVTLSLRFGHDLRPSEPEALLISLVHLPGSWRIGFEVEVRSGAPLRHLLRVPPILLQVVLAHLHTAIGRLRVDQVEDDPFELTAASEFSVDGDRGLLATDRPDMVSAALLAALSTVSRGERLHLQWVLAPHRPGDQIARIARDVRLLMVKRSGLPPDEKIAQEKESSPSFVAVLRIGAKAATVQRANRLIQLACAPLGIVRSPTSRLAAGSSGIGAVGRLYGAAAAGFFSGGVLTVAELVGVLGWPIGSPQISGLQLGVSRHLPPGDGIEHRGIVLGTSTMPGARQSVALSRTGILQHLAVTAPTGTGKSAVLGNVALQAMEQGLGLVVMDWKGDLARNLLDRIPDARIQDVIVYDPTDPKAVVGLPNALGGEPHERDLMVDSVIGWLASSWGSSWGPRTASVVQASLFALAAAGGYCLLDLPELLTNRAMRRRVLGASRHAFGIEAAWAGFSGMSEAEWAQVIAPTMNRTRPWLLRRDVRHVLGQVTSTFTFDEVLSGKILIVSLASGQLGQETARLLGLLIAGQVQTAIQRRSRLPERLRKPALVIFDEFQHLPELAGAFEHTLTMARGLGVGFVLAHQHLAQLDTKLKEAVLANVRSRLAFQMAATDAALIAREFGGLVTAGDFLHLPSFEAIARLVTPHGLSAPVSIRTSPLPTNRRTAERVRSESRRRYALGRETIDREIRERHSGTATGRTESIGRRKLPGGEL